MPPLYRISILLFCCSFFLSYVLTPLAGKFALKFNIMDSPGSRKIHHEVTPRNGGLAIFLSFCITLILLYLIISLQFLHYGKPFLFLFSQVKLFWLKTALYLIGALVVILVGILDDIKSIDFKVKLLGQGLAAAIIIWGSNSTIRIFPVQWDILNTFFTFFWIIILTNSFNLLDNMNGLSPGIASIIILFFIAISFILKQFLLVLFLTIPMGCILGFLPHNFPKAKIFLGDMGSLFIGFSLATYSIWIFNILMQSNVPQSTIILGMLCLLMIPLFDTLTVILIRIKNKKPIYVGDTNHLSHQLVKCGLSTTNAVLILLAGSIGAGLLGLLYVTP